MLMRHTHVAQDGTVRPPRLQQLSYGPLINGRVTIVNGARASRRGGAAPHATLTLWSQRVPTLPRWR